VAMTDLSGKWALVTGASRGVGRLVALGLAQEGCNVVLHSRKRENSVPVLEEIEALGAQAVLTEGSLDNAEAVEAMLVDVLSQAPQINVLYNNAAIMSRFFANPWEASSEEFRKVFEVNVVSLIRICNRLTPLMIERGFGRVVNLTSGIADQPQLGPYAVSKGAVDKFTKDFAPTLAGTGVTMNTLDPGWLRTDMGGPNAPGDPLETIPGALVPAFLDDGVSGRRFASLAYTGLSLEEAVDKARASS